MVAAAMVGSAVISAGVGYAASTSAAKTQAGAANRATDLQGEMFDKAQANLSPYMQHGADAGQTLAGLLGPGGRLTQSFTPADYLANKDPGYDFQLKQGQQALQNSQAAGNGVLTGSAMKDLIGYNQGMAATGYQSAFGRWQAQNDSLYQRLMGMYGVGENAAAGVGNMGVQTGSNMAGTIMGAGNAQAAGQIGAANAITGG